MNSAARPSGLRTLLTLMAREPRALFLSIWLALLGSLITAPVPFLSKIIIDEIIFRGGSAAGLPGASRFLGLPANVWLMAAIVLLGITLKLAGTFLGAWQSHFILRITRNVLFRLRLETALRVCGAPQRCFETTEPARMASRLTQDVAAMDGAMFAILKSVLSSAFLVAVVIAFMLVMNPLLTAVILVTLPLTALLTLYAFARMRHYSLLESDRQAALNAAGTEVFSGIKILRAFNAEPYFLTRLAAACEVLRSDGIRHWTLFHAINALCVFLSNLGGDIFLFVGGVLALNGRISFGEFFAFYGYQAMLWGPINTLLNSGTILQTGAASAEKVQSLASLPQEPHLERTGLHAPATLRGEIVCENLGFEYFADEPILRDVSLTVRPGSMTALVGQSGSGKTTLANLLLGFHLPTRGRLLIDGVDIRQWNLRALRRHVGVVLQEPIMFHDTIRNNITLGADCPDDDRIWAALKLAHLNDFVERLPEKLDSPVGVGGARLSGGQRQRIAIARVFFKNPSLLILDEATSALDSETEKAIQRSFDALMAGRTSIVIAHRLATIFQADQIAVMYQGRVVETGAHEDLAKSPSSHYRHLYEAQVAGLIPMSGATRKPWNRAQP